MSFCRKCGAQNNPGAKFCRVCGMPLSGPAAEPPEQPAPKGPVCPKCGRENNPGAKFCRICGGSLETDTPISNIPKSEAERKTVSVFSDIAIPPKEQKKEYKPVIPIGTPSKPEQTAKPKQTVCSERSGKPVKPSGKPPAVPKEPQKHGRLILNILLGAACLGMLVLAVTVVPGRIQQAEKPIQTFEETDLPPEVLEEMEQIDSGRTLYEFSKDGTPPQTHELPAWYYGEED